MGNARWQSLVITPIIGLVVPLSLLLFLETTLTTGSPAVQAGGTTRYVATTGSDTTGCADPGAPCRTVQYAVDQAQSGDEVLVATGVYAGVQARADVNQVVYISKTLTIRGGYTTTNWTTSYPITQPTTLDAQGQGRVIYITGSTITPTVEGLRITGGGAGSARGGGVYGDGGAVTLRGNVISGNSAGGGGGVYLAGGNPTLISNTVESNTVGEYGYGGGVYLRDSNATVSANTVQSNTVGSYGNGGGVYLYGSSGVVRGNTISANTVTNQGSGGGLVLWSGSTLVEANTIVGNLAQTFGQSGGGAGGVYIVSDSSTLQANTIVSNTASKYGGGVYVHSSPSASVIANLIQGNQSDTYGGGIYAASDFNLEFGQDAREQAGRMGRGRGCAVCRA